MAVRSREDAASLRSLARSMYFSNEAIDALLASATASEARCVSDFISSELAIRARNKRERLYRRAQFPQPKSVEGYDFSQVSFPEGYGPSDLMSLAFVERAEDFVFLGPTGRGKTHLAIAVGAACVNAGRAVRFFTSRSGDLERLMSEIARCDLLVLDEFGYVPIDVEGARLLFQVMSDCYERRSMILTTNIEFSKWGVVLGDDKLASALIDRIVHHGRLVEFGGASRRMEDALMLGKGGGDAV